MDVLLGQVLDLLKRLEALERLDAAHEILQALTDGCGPRELLDALRNAMADLKELPPELMDLRAGILDEIERCWRELPQGGR